MIGEQLQSRIHLWTAEAEALLAEPNNGIPTITEIQLRRRRVQKNRKLSIQMEEERKRASRVSQETENLRNAGSLIELSNDQLMKMGNDRLERRSKLVDVSTVGFWKATKAPSVKEWIYLCIKSMPCLGELVVVPRTKKQAEAIISLYLRRAKYITNHIHVFVYGKGDDKPKKSKQMVTKEDLLDWFGIFRDTEEAWSQVETTLPAAVSLLETLTTISNHYTKTTGTRDHQYDTDDEGIPSDDEDVEEV